MVREIFVARYGTQCKNCKCGAFLEYDSEDVNVQYVKERNGKVVPVKMLTCVACGEEFCL